MFQGRGELHEGAEIPELVTLPGQLDEELQHVAPVLGIALLGHTPHEEQ